ncbi:PAS domain S-box protein [bacterium]|nr:PAS domain S-box protein [bacterium]
MQRVLPSSAPNNPNIALINRYEAVIHASGQIVFDWDPRTNTIVYEGNVTSILGYEKDELNGDLNTWLEFIHPDDIVKFCRVIEKVLIKKDPFSLEYRIRKKDRSYITARQEGYFFLDENQTIVRLVGLIQDITSLKVAEESIRETESNFKAFFDNMSAGIYQITLDGSFIIVNPALVRILGYQDEQDLMAHNLFRDIFINHDEGLQIHHNALAHQKNILYEALWKTKDGQPLKCEISLRAVHHTSTQFLYFEATASDVTEKRRLESKIRHAEKMELIGQMSGGIVHDFNNMLSIIKASLSILKIDINDQTKLLKSINRISDAADRAASLCEKILSFSRRQELKLELLTFNKLIESIQPLLETTLPPSITVTSELTSAPHFAHVDKAQMEQVVINLCYNARDAMPTGGHLWLSTSNVYVPSSPVVKGCKVQQGHCNLCYVKNGDIQNHLNDVPCFVPDGHYACLQVKDSGVGMSEETMRKVYEPFFTTKGAGKGTGLGLSMAYSLIKEHQGYIDIQSFVDQGTTIRIYLPAVIHH